MQTPPTIEPSSITAGDTISWLRTLPDYPATDGWVLNYALRGAQAIDIVGTASGSDHLITITPFISSTYAAGLYSVQGYIVLASARVTIYSGSITIKPNLVTAAAGYDGRSHVKRVLDSIEAVIEGRATKGDQELTIDGTRLVKMTAIELLDLRGRYKIEYRKELQAARVAQGRSSGRKIVTRFRH